MWFQIKLKIVSRVINREKEKTTCGVKRKLKPVCLWWDIRSWSEHRVGLRVKIKIIKINNVGVSGSFHPPSLVSADPNEPLVVVGSPELSARTERTRTGSACFGAFLSQWRHAEWAELRCCNPEQVARQTGAERDIPHALPLRVRAWDSREPTHELKILRIKKKQFNYFGDMVCFVWQPGAPPRGPQGGQWPPSLLGGSITIPLAICYLEPHKHKNKYCFWPISG